MPRFNLFAQTIPEVLNYYQNRAYQLLYDGWSWDGKYNNLDWGIEVQFIKDRVIYDNLYLLKKGHGHFSRWIKDKNYVLMPGHFSVFEWLYEKEISYQNAQSYNSSYYKEVDFLYRDKEIDGSFLMNKIDQNLFLLKRMNAANYILDAFSLSHHYGNDQDLIKNWNNSLFHWHEASLTVLAMEFKKILEINKKKIIIGPNDLQISPLPEVNLMLKAEIISERKSFEEQQKKDFNKDWLYRDWFDKIGITEEFYLDCVKEINSRIGR